jgi:serine/threonine protein kinase/Flp pilus assembly protein TadD
MHRTVKVEPADPGESKAAGLTQREIRACPACGTKFSATGDSGLCPVCVLLGAAGRDSALPEALDPVAGSERGSKEIEPGSTGRHFEHYEVMLDQDGKPVELGRGAMGVTYKAFDIDLRFPVTLKVISERYVGDESAHLRFLREARAAAKVRHTNVASVLHLGRTGSGYFYAMEFVEGETLESLIRRSGRLEIRLALEIAAQVAAGLEAIHEQKLVHRDIKPTNIMVRSKDEGRVTAKIIDLGLAKGVSEPSFESAISTTGSFAGTPDFASPEHFAGLPVDIRSDLYSLGITLWEMLYGNVPFGGSAAELMYQHQHAAPPTEKLIGIPAPVIALLEVLLAKDPNQRFQTPAQLLKALTKVRGAIDSGSQLTADGLRSAGEPATETLPQGKPSKKTVRRVLGATLCFVGVLIAWFFFSGHAGSLFNQRVVEALPSGKSIAVLPFENISPNKDDAYFADGVQDEILNNLAKITQLKVISRTSVMQYRADTKRDLRQIANALGVANVLEGTLRRDGNHVRVSTELVDARNDTTIWADSYDRDLTDIFAIQSEIAQTVASKLSARLSSEEQKNIGEKPTANLEAYDLYLQAKELVANWGFVYQPNDPPKAIKLLEEATGKDPKFTLAYCVLARAHDDLYHFQIDNTPQRRALADAAINQAVQLEPNNPEVHLATAYHLYSCYRNYERASVQIKLAQRTLPNSAEALWLAARIDRRLGRWKESTKALEKGYSLDPRNGHIIAVLGVNYDVLDRYREAEQIYDRLYELEPDSPLLKNRKVWYTFLRTGDPTSYRAALDQLPSSIKDHERFASIRFWYALWARDWTAANQILGKNPDDDLIQGNLVQVPIPHRCGEIWLAAFEGKHPTMETGFGVARDQLAQRVEAHPDDVELLSVLGIIDAFLGRKQEAIEEATRAVELRPISQDAVEGPFILQSLAVVYIWANEPDLAFQELGVLVKTPAAYLDKRARFKDPTWDPIRKDPRFDKLLAQLAPRD